MVRRGWELHPQIPDRIAIYKIAGLADAQPLRSFMPRLLVGACFLLAPAICSAQSPAQGVAMPVAEPTVSFTGTTTTARTASPDETVSVNGRIVKVADLLPLLSLDNLGAPNLHIPVNQNREKPQQELPQPKSHQTY